MSHYSYFLLLPAVAAHGVDLLELHQLRLLEHRQLVLVPMQRLAGGQAHLQRRVGRRHRSCSARVVQFLRTLLRNGLGNLQVLLAGEGVRFLIVYKEVVYVCIGGLITFVGLG